ncbi:MAG: hypothetical protein IJ565_04390 [Bacilli bacterium]|nr:hypothetical protein [Bacilli bacterium]
MGDVSEILLSGICYFIFFLLIAIYIIYTLYMVITYVFDSLAVMNLSNNKIKAWIPFYNKYLLGNIANLKVLGIISALICFIVNIIYISFYKNQYSAFSLSVIIIGMLVGYIIEIIIANKIFKESDSKHAKIYTILSVLTLGFSRPICLFLLKKRRKKFN